MSSLISAVRAFRALRVLVVGDSMVDCYCLGTATRISPEGPVPVVRSTGKRYMPGGAANTAANVAALGASVTLLSVVGTDHEANVLREILANHGVDSSNLVVDPSRPTTTKTRIIAGGHFLARFDEEANTEVSGHVADAMIVQLRRLFRQSDVVIVSDYTKGAVFPGLVAELGRLNRDQSRSVVVDSKDLSRHRYRNVSVITPNHLEAQKAANLNLSPGLDEGEEAPLEAIGRSLLEQIGTRWVMVTMGAGGALLIERDGPAARIRTRDVRSPDVVGAGDSLTAALALGLSSGLAIADAARVAIEAASIAVAKPFTAVVEQHELLQRLTRPDDVERIDDIAPQLEEYRQRGKTIVLTNGEFDGLHSGHIAFLSEARRLGDVLVVGVNSDRSIQRRAGHAPLLPETERLSVVGALESVDHAILFDEETPLSLIRRVRPHVHVKGGDYEGELLPEAVAIQEVGAESVILPLQEPELWPLADAGVARRRRSLSVIRGGAAKQRSDLAADLPEEAAG